MGGNGNPGASASMGQTKMLPPTMGQQMPQQQNAGASNTFPVAQPPSANGMGSNTFAPPSDAPQPQAAGKSGVNPGQSMGDAGKPLGAGGMPNLYATTPFWHGGAMTPPGTKDAWNQQVNQPGMPGQPGVNGQAPAPATPSPSNPAPQPTPAAPDPSTLRGLGLAKAGVKKKDRPDIKANIARDIADGEINALGLGQAGVSNRDRRAIKSNVAQMINPVGGLGLKDAGVSKADRKAIKNKIARGKTNNLGLQKLGLDPAIIEAVKAQAAAYDSPVARKNKKKGRK